MPKKQETLGGTAVTRLNSLASRCVLLQMCVILFEKILTTGVWFDGVKIVVCVNKILERTLAKGRFAWGGGCMQQMNAHMTKTAKGLASAPNASCPSPRHQININGKTTNTPSGAPHARHQTTGQHTIHTKSPSFLNRPLRGDDVSRLVYLCGTHVPANEVCLPLSVPVGFPLPAVACRLSFIRYGSNDGVLRRWCVVPFKPPYKRKTFIALLPPQIDDLSPGHGMWQMAGPCSS